MENKNTINFIESHSVIGEHFSMTVNGKSYNLERGLWKYNQKYGDEKDHAIFILKREYGIVKHRDEIKFEWDGTL